MSILLAVFIPLVITPLTPVVEIGVGESKIDVYQLSDKVCMFEFADKKIHSDTLYFLNPVDCRDIAFQYRWQP